MNDDTKPDIYRQFDAAFARVSAYNVSTADGRNVGRVCFKLPADGAGRLWCYVQVWGAPMVRGHAGGYGYDKSTAAFENAAAKLKADTSQTPTHARPHDVLKWRKAGAEASGVEWQHRLEALGYVVQHVI